MSNLINNILCVALEFGITEDRFMKMTISEVERELGAAKRRIEAELKEKAYFDYIHAVTITSMVVGKPRSLYDTYPTLFEKEREELSVMRFMQFAERHNNRKGEECQKE